MPEEKRTSRIPFKECYLTLVLLGSGGPAELLLGDSHAQTKIKLLLCILHLLTEALFCIYQQLKI